MGTYSHEISRLSRFFFCEISECEYGSSDHMAQGILEKHVVLPAVKAEGHFVQIGGEMLDADVMPRSDDAALEQRERAFHGVGVNVARDVDGPVADSPVSLFVLPVERPRIDGRFIGNEHLYGLADVLADNLRDRRGFGVFGAEQPQIPVTLADADDHFLFLAG